MFSQPQADQVRLAIAVYSAAWSGKDNVKEIKRPIFVYKVDLLETH
jgi:hypothetical protein